MRLVRIGEPGLESSGVLLDDDHFVDISDEFPSFTGQFFGPESLDGVARLVEERVKAGRVSAIDGRRIGSPLGRPHQILCVGLNYLDHISETATIRPTSPLIFSKSPNSMSGPFDPIIAPRGSTKLDYEVELGVVMGQRLHYATSEDEAMRAIAGYVLVNDVSERSFQLETAGQWIIGKSGQSFNPCGPFLATADEIADPMDVDLSLSVNGSVRQSASTREMLFSVAEIVVYLSQYLVLEPGDLINTGTPAGVGMGMTPQAFLQLGDEVRLSGSGLGAQTCLVTAAEPAVVAR